MAKNLIEKITEKQINPNVPEFRVGDTVNVGCKIIEVKSGKERERIQNFEGLVIARKGTGVSSSGDHSLRSGFIWKEVSAGVIA